MQFNNTIQRIKFHCQGDSPKVILDIGAHIGSYVDLFKMAFPEATIYAIEPDPLSYRFLSSKSCEAIQELVSDISGKEVIFYTKPGCPTGASYMREIYGGHYEQDNLELHIKTISLDDLVEKYRIPKIDLIKIDTQGSELDIFRGAKRVLSKYNPKFISMECNIVEYNSGAPLIDEQIGFMRELGYHILDITETHFIADRLVQVDFLFMNDQYKKVLDSRN